MVHVTRRYRCDKCRKGFPSWDDARDCEIGHVTDAAIAEFKKELKRIFDRGETVNNRARP